jgi:putative endonuclease
LIKGFIDDYLGSIILRPSSGESPERVEKLMSQWHWYVYIIECLDGTYYTGMTWDVAERWEQHVVGKGSEYTKKHWVKKMAYYEEHDNFDTAAYREKQIKDWNQTKKRKLINGEWKSEW